MYYKGSKTHYKPLFKFKLLSFQNKSLDGFKLKLHNLITNNIFKYLCVKYIVSTMQTPMFY